MYEWVSLASSADLDLLVEKIAPEFNPKFVVAKLKDGISDSVKAVLIEGNYVDKDYRSTYYNFYAKKGRKYSSDCLRLHFFSEAVSFDSAGLKLACTDGNQLAGNYYGFMVLRPTGIATIGRSVLTPHMRKGAHGRFITAEHKVSLLGYDLSVRGMPSMDQHSDISVCAHAACWSILRHYSEKYCLYKEHLTYDITLMAQEFNPGGLVPSKGLAVSHAERVFQAAGTFPLHIARKKDADDPVYYRQLLAYLESGFPLFAAMHDRGHAVAITGFKWNSTLPGSTDVQYAWDGLEKLVVIDDNHLPYISIPLAPDGTTRSYTAKNIDAFIVPLPEKVFYPAEAVDKLATRLLTKFPLVEMPAEKDTVIRYFITTGAEYRKFMREQSSIDSKLTEIVMALPFSQYVWIIEYATKEEWAVNKITARAVVDATASERDPLSLWMVHGNKNVVVFKRDGSFYANENTKNIELENASGSALMRMDKLYSF